MEYLCFNFFFFSSCFLITNTIYEMKFLAIVKFNKYMDE